jgi:hypothetical protein
MGEACDVRLVHDDDAVGCTDAQEVGLAQTVASGVVGGGEVAVSVVNSLRKRARVLGAKHVHDAAAEFADFGDDCGGVDVERGIAGD